MDIGVPLVLYYGPKEPMSNMKEILTVAQALQIFSPRPNPEIRAKS